MQKNNPETIQSIKIEAILTFPQFPRKSTICRCPVRSSKKESHPENSLRLAAEILLKLATGQYSECESSGIWEILEALLSSYSIKNGGHNG